ncbi:MAG: DUF1501 domain-containing protein [Bryobacterales bacterium]|nr:DUF1501 domain-containing protein [Bryobacterales bacterium]
MNTRRIFLKQSALAMAGFGAAPLWIRRALAATDEAARRKVLVTIFLRGAADGLNILVPFTEQAYYDVRPTLAVPRPGRDEGAISLDGRFGLHPALAPLERFYKEKLFSAVVATGSPDPTRSHFDAQDYMESGTPGRKSTQDGWLNRALSPLPDGSPVRAVSIGPRLPRSLRGAQPAVALNTVEEFRVKQAGASVALESMYAGSHDAALGAAGRETFEAMKLLEPLRRQSYSPGNGASYPRGKLGAGMEQIARLIKANVGLQVAFTDLGGWDHHTNERAQLPGLLRQFGGAMAAFAQDMGSRMEDIAVVAMSEFGRTVRENGNGGTDHGHANTMFLMGGPVAGGAIYGQWPGLDRDCLHEGRDLAVTTDFRDVLASFACRHLGVANAASVFPGFTQPPGGWEWKRS